MPVPKQPKPHREDNYRKTARFQIQKRWKEVLTWRNTLLRQVKSYIDNNLNPAKVNMIDATKENFTQPLHIKEILDEFEISMDD